MSRGVIVVPVGKRIDLTRERSKVVGGPVRGEKR